MSFRCSDKTQNQVQLHFKKVQRGTGKKTDVVFIEADGSIVRSEDKQGATLKVSVSGWQEFSSTLHQ